MIKTIALLLIISLACAGVAGCANTRTICGETYQPYGLFNRSEKKNPDIAYEVSWGSVIIGTILVETIIVPIYIFGFNVMQPVGKPPKIKGTLPDTSCQ